MRIAALVLGIIGGLLGIVGAVFALTVGGIANVSHQGSGDNVVGLGLAAFVFCFIGFLGAGFSMAKPRLAALLLAVAGVGITISISWGALGAAPLFLIAALFAFLGRKSAQPVVQTTA